MTYNIVIKGYPDEEVANEARFDAEMELQVHSKDYKLTFEVVEDTPAHLKSFGAQVAEREGKAFDGTVVPGGGQGQREATLDHP